eukprot:gene23405-30679_t
MLAAAKKPSLGIMINNEYGELPASRMQIDNPGTKTVPMGYSFATNQKLAPAPSAYQGFGRLDLSRSLPLLGDQLGWQLQVVDMVAIVSRQTLRYKVQILQYKVQVTGQGPLIVVLSWYDYPSFPGASGRLLINDLDLTLTNPDSTSTWGGNQGPKPITQQLVQRDNVNNIEKIILEAPKAGAYTIRVNGNILNGNLPPTAFSLPPTAYRLPPTAYRLPPTAYRLPPTAFSLPPSAFSLPPSAHLS